MCSSGTGSMIFASNKGTLTPFPHYWTTCGSPGLAEEWLQSAVEHRMRGRTVYLHRQDEKQDPAQSLVQTFSPFPLAFTISLPRSCGLPYLVQSWSAGE